MFELCICYVQFHIFYDDVRILNVNKLTIKPKMSKCCSCGKIACSHVVIADAIKEASQLTDHERVAILKVLGRDELLRRQQELSVRHLKAELQNLRRKGALRPSTDWDNTGPDPDRSCGRCRVELGRVINRGAFCRACRLKVCKSCREYSFRATDWVCSVCHKHMEIQAASGEWMNEFVRRPSRRRDNRVYVPAADIIKRTIRRSWTISNPTPPWNSSRKSPEMRPYNSLPRGQDIADYPSLQRNNASMKNQLTDGLSTSSSPKRPLPTRRTQSEDIYSEKINSNSVETPLESSPNLQRSTRINPLILYAQKDKPKNTRRKTGKLSKESDESKNGDVTDEACKVSTNEKRVSFDEYTEEIPPKSPKYLCNTKKAASLTEFPFRNHRFKNQTKSVGNEEISISSPETSSSGGGGGAGATPKEENNKECPPLELCDIESISGTVFRKVTTVRRRRHDIKKMSAIDNGWRLNDTELHPDIFVPESDDYKLVFISSDSSSKEEDIDDNDSSSASSFPIDECDWDYFEPGAVTKTVLSWNSPFGSPRGYRRNLIESPIGSPLVYRRKTTSHRESDTGTDDDIRLDTGSPASSDSFIGKSKDSESSNEVIMEDVTVRCKHKEVEVQASLVPPCQSCGAPTQYIPIPVPVPIPVPIPTLWTTSQDAIKFYGTGVLNETATLARLRIFPRNLWPFLNNSAALNNVWPLMGGTQTQQQQFTGYYQESESGSDEPVVPEVYNETVTMEENNRDDDDERNKESNSSQFQQIPDENEQISGYLESENRPNDSSSSSSSTSDSDSDDGYARKTCRIYNVNGRDGDRESDDALPSSNLSSCDDEDDEAVNQSQGDNEIMTSSCSEDSDSDDTGTDQKTKKFSRVFVVNKDEDSPSSQHSSSSESETENDPDEELDCFVVLRNIKYINDDDSMENETKERLHLDDNKLVQYNFKNVPVDVLSDNPDNSDIAKCDQIVLSSSPAFLKSGVADDDENSNINEKIRSIALREVGEFDQQLSTITSSATSSSTDCCCSPGPGVSVTPDQSGRQQNAARYKSLVMITQEPTTEIASSSSATNFEQVCVVTSDTTTFVNDNNVTVKHTNLQTENGHENPDSTVDHTNHPEGVTVITGGGTLSAFEEGLADDDSWVENISHDEDDFGPSSITTEDSSSSGDEVTLTCSVASVLDHEDELRGYHRAAIDFTLHTIVEESCEESEVEQSNNFSNDKQQIHQHRESATDLEKYFFFGLCDNTSNSINTNRAGEDAFSETSSVYSEGLDSLSNTDEQQQQQQKNDNSDQSELASSRLEKYFLTGFMGFNERRDSDGSVGSDSEGKPSPEQRRKRLVRARGTGRSHSNSLDNILITSSNPELSNNDGGNNEASNDSENSSSSNSDTEEAISFDKNDGQFDTVKRKKNKKKDEHKNLETTQEVNEEANSEVDQDDGVETPQSLTTNLEHTTNLVSNTQQQSRDSGFIGSCDDLLKEQNNTGETKNEIKSELENIEEKKEDKVVHTLPPTTALTRKDSFNNWSSDEETNLMMCKMRQFFKTMIAAKQTTSSPNMSHKTNFPNSPSPSIRKRCKPPQLIYFENELTRLMKTVPGIRDDQVREIVEYLSSEDTWSDSYDSSDYTSSDLETTTNKSALQKQISESCKKIINKFDVNIDDEGDEGDGGIIDEKHLNKETAFVYQKLVASFEKMATDKIETPPNNSPPLIAKVMHHIGSRLVALMHEVSSGESQNGNSPKAIRHYHHRRLQQKLSNASSTTTDDDNTTEHQHDTLSALEDNFSYSLPRSKSHDLLSKTNQTGSGEITVEEREASDCERFSWRGSFESALLATDSRNRLSIIGSEGSASALAIAAKRRSAGDLIFSHKSLSREQLDRVRSCGSIGGASSEDKLWVSTTITSSRPNRRRSSVPDAAASCGSGGSADGEDDDDDDDETNLSSTIRNNLQNGTTNSLPRLPTNTPINNSMLKAQSHHFLPQNVKSARYRPPGFNRLTTVPKRAVSAPGLQPSHQRRGRRSQQNVPSDDAIISEAHSSPTLGTKSGNKSATPSPIITAKSRSGTLSSTNSDWQNAEGDIDRLMTLQGRSSLSSLGLRSDSMASVYSGAGEGRYGTVTVKGHVEFGLQYNYKAGDLEIHIKQCKDLAPVDIKRNRSDPYVKVYLLPDKSKSGKRKTKVKKHTLNPIFDETLKFHISLNGLETRTLWLTVWHSDMFGRNDFLGEVMMTLENKVFDDPSPKLYNLQERTEPFDDTISFKGDIIVCLKFVPPDMTVQKKGKRSRGTLHVLVKEAKCLTAYKANGTSDPFCKSYLLPDKGRNSKQKTQVMKKTVNPVWNHTFVYDDVTLQELSERCLELTVWDHDRLASNEFLGGVRFSLGTGKHYGKSVEWMDSTGKEISLWKSMLERPNFWVEGCLSLRPTLEARSS